MPITTYYKRFLITAAIGCMITVFSSCKKYLEIDLPKDKLTAETVFSSATNALAAVNGLYTFALQPRNFITYQGDFLMGMAADEFVYGSTQYDEFTKNGWLATNADVAATWKLFYAVIYQANGIIEKMPGSSGISDSAKAVYIAEVKIFRAFCHLYLTSYWGDVPLIQTTDVTVSAHVGRTPKADVLNAILTDLTEAEAALPAGTVRNGRFNKFMATALLARVNLYQKNWSAAEAKATALIGNTTNFTLLTDLTKVFLRGSKEAIWQINSADNNYTYFTSFNVPAATTTSTKSLSMVRPELYNAFETGDKRKTNWLGSTTIAGTFFYYDLKYKQLAAPTSTANIEDYMLLRLAEQYLIRAEARAQQENLTGAIDDLNVIRTRAGLTPLLYGLSKSDVLLAVEKERKLELFGEGYGHRWIDLARTGRIDAVLGSEKPSTWKSSAAWLPVPQNELTNNPALNP
jgi:starch-binding outer membrane protein, SusD/RagB family